MMETTVRSVMELLSALSDLHPRLLCRCYRCLFLIRFGWVHGQGWKGFQDTGQSNLAFTCLYVICYHLQCCIIQEKINDIFYLSTINEVYLCQYKRDMQERDYDGVPR